MRLKKEDCFAVVVDFQEKLMPVIDRQDEVLRRAEILVQGLQALEVPVIVTRQYPKGLGDTAMPLRDTLGDAPVLDKMTFSIMGEPDIQGAIEKIGRKTAIVCGVETHICVLQSVIDLQAAGYQTVLVSDAVSSRQPADRQVGIDRAMQEGSLITSVESLLFELTERAGGDVFKTISKLIK